MNAATHSAIVVAACKALFATANTAPAIVRLLTDPSEPESQLRQALKFLFAVNDYNGSPQASESSVEAKLRSYVGLKNVSGESVKVTAPGLNGVFTTYSVS